MQRPEQGLVGGRFPVQRQRIGAGGGGHPEEAERPAVDGNLRTLPDLRRGAAILFHQHARGFFTGRDNGFAGGNPAEKGGDVGGFDDLQELVRGVVLKPCRKAPSPFPCRTP